MLLYSGVSKSGFVCGDTRLHSLAIGGGGRAESLLGCSIFRELNNITDLFGLLGPISSVISFDFCYLLISSGWQNPCKILKVVHAWGKINFMWWFLKNPQLYHDLAVLYIGCSAAEDIQFYKEKKNPTFFLLQRQLCILDMGASVLLSSLWYYVIEVMF